MRQRELLVIGLAYVVATSVGSGLLILLRQRDLGMAFVAGAILGTLVGAHLYYARNSGRAPLRAKGAVGGLLALLCLVQGVAAQLLTGRIPVPEVTIPLSMLGCFVFPFLLFDAVRRVP
jgi:hypothetical protein